MWRRETVIGFCLGGTVAGNIKLPRFASREVCHARHLILGSGDVVTNVPGLRCEVRDLDGYAHQPPADRGDFLKNVFHIDIHSEYWRWIPVDQTAEVWGLLMWSDGV
ncbi:hypothetical protein NDU88_003066 [Pleurodeles waltl]|uniref:Uncharacterized protein n=1 Tax=Pleurodeles waltl TaxID=8319 RepID=A0AAV7W4Z9_PLEWA|nr:hypothetical protein NDU88_003066 [Pleurodeles waltl]